MVSLQSEVSKMKTLNVSCKRWSLTKGLSRQIKAFIELLIITIRQHLSHSAMNHHLTPPIQEFSLQKFHVHIVHWQINVRQLIQVL